MVARCAADIAARIPGCSRSARRGADHLLLAAGAGLVATGCELASEGGYEPGLGERFRLAG